MDYSQVSMLDVAYDLMMHKKKAVDFNKLYKEVCEIKGFDEAASQENQSLFYTNIALDGRFITTGENRWDLRERHKFEDVHIDMNDIYADYQDDDDRDPNSEEEEEFFDEEEQDDGTFADTDSFDD